MLVNIFTQVNTHKHVYLELHCQGRQMVVVYVGFTARFVARPVVEGLNFLVSSRTVIEKNNGLISANQKPTYFALALAS